MPKRNLSDLVLETIDIISARKYRPNLLRIYRHLNKFYDLSLQTCEQLIQKLLTERKVIRVTYKGHISYRNAVKWKKYSYYMSKNMDSAFPGSILTNAISELIVEEPDYLEIGVPYDILEQHILAIPNINISKPIIQKVLQRELNFESLQQYENGNYFLGPKPPKSLSFDRLEISNAEKVDIEEASNHVSTDSLCVSAEESSSHIRQHGSRRDTKYNVTNNNNGKAFNGERVVSDDDNSNESIEFLLSKKCVLPNDTPTLNGENEEISSQIQDKNHNTSQGSNSKKLKHISRLCNNKKKLKSFPDVENSNSFISDYGDNVSEMDVASVSSVSQDHIDKVDRSKESSDDTEDHSDSKTSTNTTPIKEYNSNEDEKEEKEDAEKSLILERGKRKKKTTFDESFYYFPSSKKKKSKDMESEKKDDKDRKKKKKKKEKKENSGSSSFVKNVMFPGNTSMCCECKCYGSKVKSDTMISCARCSNQAHQSCASKSTVGKEWYCLDCRQDAEIRTSCGRMPCESDRGLLYLCNQCGSDVHKGCSSPAVKLPLSDSWRCYTCPGKRSKEYFSGDPPDSSKWTSEDVYQYFCKYFEEDIAEALKEQDIDGATLKLMDRSDVLNLNFKLGIRMKILLHVKRLQLRTNSLNEIWES